MPTRRTLVLVALLAAGCTPSERHQAYVDSVRKVATAETLTMLQGAGRTAVVAGDSAILSADTAPRRPALRYRALTPLEQEVANAAAFAPRMQDWFVVAVRARRLLVDVGRFDAKPRPDSAWHRALSEAARRYGPVREGTTLRLRGPWGVEDARVAGFDAWNGRIVATIEVSDSLAALARKRELLAGTAQRIVPSRDSATAPADTATVGATTQAGATTGAGGPHPGSPAEVAAPPIEPCRDTLPTLLATRVGQVRDSVALWMADSLKIPLPRLAKGKVEAWSTAGCFGGASRAMVLVSRRNPTGELAVDRAFLVNGDGSLVRLVVRDYRFRAHEPTLVADLDGDGVDDLVARGYGERSGALTTLRVDAAARSLVRIATGFAWESN